MKKKILSIIMMLVIALTGTVSAYAGEAPADAGDGEKAGPQRDTNNVHIVARRTSATSANVSINILFSDVVDSYNVVVYLQKKVNGEWVLDTTNPEYVFYNNGYKKDEFSFGHVYTNLKEGTIYRIWCVSKDTVGTSSYNSSYYSSQF